jgi:hypothetical protein
MNEILDEILNDPLRTERESEYKKKFPDFFEKYPKLGCMVFSSNEQQMSILKYMLQEKERITDEQSQYDASVRVGTVLRDEYISPLLQKK